jgi:hypothetical protein
MNKFKLNFVNCNFDASKSDITNARKVSQILTEHYKQYFTLTQNIVEIKNKHIIITGRKGNYLIKEFNLGN